MELSNKFKKKDKKLNNTQYHRRYAISYSSLALLKNDLKNNVQSISKYSSKIIDIKKNVNSLTTLERTILANNLFLEFEKKELLQLYGEEENINIQKEKLLPIINFNKVCNCSIMEYGAKKSTKEIDYSYCKTCNYNSLKPICMSCINKCHYGHVIKFNFRKGKIKCSCGEKNHLTMKIGDYKNTKIECLCNEWNFLANLNYYYINHKQEPICIFCHFYCQNDNNNDKLIKLKNNDLIQQCSCENNDIHKDKRIIYEKLLNLISISNDFNILLHPIQIVNMIFASNNCFKNLFEYFVFFMEDLNNSRNCSHIIEFFSKIKRIDIEYTNIYKTLLIFEKIIQKTEKNNIYFYNEAVPKYFSFDIIKKLLDILIQSSIDKKLFWQLINKYLYLFHKIYLDLKFKSLNKFKLQDLKYLNFFCRITFLNQNKKQFKESQIIISFLINFLIYINNKNALSLDAIQCLKEILSIFRKLSCYNLIKNNDMVKICKNILESFNWIRNVKNDLIKNNQNDIKLKIDLYNFNNISIKTFYVILKILLNFIYNFNDNMIDNIINNKKKYPNIKDINKDNVCFIYKKNELGELIFKIAIYVLSILQYNYNKINNKRIILIQNLSVEILQYALNEDDNYFLNIKDSLYKTKFYFNFDNNNKNKIYIDYIKQAKIISNALNEYFNFERNIEEIIKIINKSLNDILGEKIVNNINTFNGDEINDRLNINQKLFLFYSNYPFLLCKIINIIHHYQNKENNNNEYLYDLIKYIPANIENKIIKKILYFYFCFTSNSPEFSFIILSHFIFKELIKIPEKYCYILFKLFYLCFENIFSSDNVAIKKDPSFLLKRLYNYLDRLVEKKPIIDNNILFCIYKFLQMIVLIIFNCQNSLLNSNIYKIQYLIIMIGKKYDLVQKYFDSEKNNNNKFNKSKIRHYSSIKLKKSNLNKISFPNQNDNIELYSFNDINLTKKIFTLYMKLVNDCFDFSFEEDRKKIKDIITNDKVFYALKNDKLNFDLKTEFLRFLRKNLIDIKYNIKENNLYVKAIINNNDHLKNIKNNILLNNTNYPTKYLSFMKDIFSISSLACLKEKLENKSNDKKSKKNNNLKNWVIENKGNKDFSLRKEISDFKETNLQHSGFFEEYKNSISSNNSSLSKNKANDNDTVFKSNDKHVSIFEKAININNENKRKNDINNINSIAIEKSELLIQPKNNNNNKNKIESHLLKLNNTELYTPSPTKKRNRLSVIIPNRDKIKLNTVISTNVSSANTLDDEEDFNVDEKDLKILKDTIKSNDNESLFNKSNHLNLLEDIFNKRFYLILNNELDNFLNKNLKINDEEKISTIKNYIENGLLIPAIFYFKKLFIAINTFSGNEMIKLYSLLEKCLKLKLYLYENKEKLCIDENDLNDNNKYISIIDYSKIKKYENFKLTQDILDDISSNKISVHDYSELHYILEKELFSLVKKRKSLNINQIFKENKKSDLEKLNKDNNKNNSNIQKRIIKSLIIYNEIKTSCTKENNSSFLSILSELNLEFETSYRHLLLSFLIHNGKDTNIKNEFSIISYYLLYKLLYLQTEETQSEIRTIIGLTELKNCGFIKDFSNILLKKIILSIIEYLNPSDILLSSNYLIACNLIFIFKYLCSKNNKIFKQYFIRSLSYRYIPNIIYFFRKTEYETYIESNIDSSITHCIIPKKPIDIKNIKFYDFLLFLISKICLISNWDKNNKNQILEIDDFLYDLFSSIIDLLAEIIYGNEIISILFENIKEKAMNIIKQGGNLDIIKNNNTFEFFVKDISYIILNKKNDTELNIKVKKKLIDFINAIIEEKNCDENIQKCIEKYLNINKVYQIIGNIMKNYFIKNKNDIQVENLMKKITLEKSDKKNNILENKMRNSVSVPRLKFESLKNIKYNIKKNELNENSINNDTNKKDLEEYSNSEVKMLSTIIDVNKDIKRNLFSLKTRHILDEENYIKYNDVLEHKNSKVNLEMKLSKLTFGKKLCDYFKNEFDNNTEFIKSFDFQLCNSLYKFIKYIKLKKEDFEQNEFDNIMKNYLKEIKTNFDDNNNKTYIDFFDSFNQEDIISNIGKDYIEKYYIEQLFENIISNIEIITPNKENKIILFTKFPLLKYISKETRIEFRQNVNRDSEISKKYDLIRYIDYFIEEINFHKKNPKEYDNFLSKINFYSLPIISYNTAIIFNLFFLFTIQGDTNISIIDTLMTRRKNENDIDNMINQSEKKWDNVYIIICISYLIINAFFIILWSIHHLPLHYKINKIKFIENMEKKRKLSFLDKVYIIISILILKGNYIMVLLYEFIVCLFCLLFKESKILYPFLLIPVLYLNKTLKNMTISIQINFKPFILTFFFAFIIMYVLTNIYFFYFNSDFIREINYFQDNYCKTLIFAFLNALDNGLRARGGMGDSAIKISYKKNRTHYLLRLLIDDIFFFLIVIIMIDMVFGIVLRSFDKLQKINHKYHLDKMNHCFICDSNRENLEKLRINYDEHVNIKHNVWNYIEYLIIIKLKDDNDLNQNDKYILDKINNKDISWLPTYKDLIKENDNFYEEKNLGIIKENFENYKIKYFEHV